MMRRIQITHPWRHGRGMLHPGPYQVPRQLSEELADRAVREGFAVELAIPDDYVRPLADYAPAKRKYTRRKKAAPENKMLDAPDNKSSVE